MTLLAFVVFTIAREHGGRFLSGAMLLPCIAQAMAGAYIVFALYSKRCSHGVLL